MYLLELLHIKSVRRATNTNTPMTFISVHQHQVCITNEPVPTQAHSRIREERERKRNLSKQQHPLKGQIWTRSNHLHFYHLQQELRLLILWWCCQRSHNNRKSVGCKLRVPCVIHCEKDLSSPSSLHPVHFYISLKSREAFTLMIQSHNDADCVLVDLSAHWTPSARYSVACDESCSDLYDLLFVYYSIILSPLAASCFIIILLS